MCITCAREGTHHGHSHELETGSRDLDEALAVINDKRQIKTIGAPGRSSPGC